MSIFCQNFLEFYDSHFGMTVVFNCV